MGMQVNVQFGKQRTTADPILKLLEVKSASQVAALVSRNGVDEKINIDVSLAVPNANYSKSGDALDGVFYGVQVRTETDFVMDVVGFRPTSETLPDNITWNSASDTTYPYYPYSAAGVTEAPIDLTGVAIPSWITTETAPERATRQKNAKLLDWNTRLQKLANDFIVGSAQIGDWVHRHAFRGHTSPKFYQALDPNSAFHANELEAGDNASYHRAKLIGIGKRLVEIYNDASYGEPMVWPACPAWSQNDTINQGDYRRHSNNRVWIAKSAHTSANANAPSTAGGAAYWEQAKMNNVPASITKADGTSVTINTGTGVGIEEYIAEVEAELKAFCAYDFYTCAREERTAWSAFYNAAELHFMDTTTHRSRQKVFDMTIAPHDSGDSEQVSAANVHSGQSWVASHDQDFLNAYKYQPPASS